MECLTYSMSESFCAFANDEKWNFCIFSWVFIKEGVFSSSFKGGRNTDSLKVALKCGGTATGNSKEFADKSKKKITQT